MTAGPEATDSIVQPPYAARMTYIVEGLEYLIRASCCYCSPSIQSIQQPSSPLKTLKLNHPPKPPTKTPTSFSSPTSPWVPNKRRATRAGMSYATPSIHPHTHTPPQHRPVLNPRPEGRRPHRAHRVQRPRSRRLGQATRYVPPHPHLTHLLVLVTDAEMPTERDEKDAIDESNILDERTRGAAKEQGSYAEPGDDEGLEGALEGNDGRSAGRQ